MMIDAAKLLLFLALPASAQVVMPSLAPLPPEVRTSSTAERSIAPNRAVVTFNLSAMALSPLQAARTVAARTDSLRRALEALGIPRDSMATGGQWYWYYGTRMQPVPTTRYVPVPNTPSQRPVIDTTYRARDAVEVRFHDLRRIGPAIDSAFAHGVTEMSGIRFLATNTEAIRDDLLREATRRARRQAEIMAEAADGQLGKTLSLSTEATRESYNPFFDLSVVTTMAAGDGRGTEVVQPTIPVRVTVSARWELVGKP